MIPVKWPKNAGQCLPGIVFLFGHRPDTRPAVRKSFMSRDEPLTSLAKAAHYILALNHPEPIPFLKRHISPDLSSLSTSHILLLCRQVSGKPQTIYRRKVSPVQGLWFPASLHGGGRQRRLRITPAHSTTQQLNLKRSFTCQRLNMSICRFWAVHHQAYL